MTPFFTGKFEPVFASELHNLRRYLLNRGHSAFASSIYTGGIDVYWRTTDKPIQRRRFSIEYRVENRIRQEAIIEWSWSDGTRGERTSYRCGSPPYKRGDLQMARWLALNRIFEPENYTPLAEIEAKHKEEKPPQWHDRSGIDSHHNGE